MLQESKQTPLLQDVDDNDAGLGGLDVSAKVETDGQSSLQGGGEDEKIKVDENDSMMISRHYLLRHGMKSRFLLQEADRFIAFTDAGEKSCE